VEDDQNRLVLRFGDGELPYRTGDSVLVALQRAGIHPTGGGTLCCGGDCPNCLVSVNGVAYVRACQVPARAGDLVTPHPAMGEPALPIEPAAALPPVRTVHTDLVVVGGGSAGTAAAAAAVSEGRQVVVLEARDGAEVVGIYPGPLVVARGEDEVLHVHGEELAIATGAMEIHPVCPGSELAGIYTPRAAAELLDAGVDLGTMVAVGDVPDRFADHRVEGRLVRFEGDGRVAAVVVSDAGDAELAGDRHPCASVVVGLGTTPRDALARMAAGMPLRVVGSAGSDQTIPDCPAEGIICPCSSVTRHQIDDVWDRGFREMELIKRATLAGTGTCQGGVCLPYLKSIIQARGGELQPSFTARPLNRQLTFGEVAAGRHLRAVPRTALDGVHRAAGARMDRIGGWWRPWTYGDTDAEYRAVREAVSIGDVSTLGKMIVRGPEAETALQTIYPTDISTIKPGRCRYVLVLDERGYVLDDGMVCREPADAGFFLTFTSGGASIAEMWLRDWLSGFDLRILNLTASMGAINVTGPRSRELLTRLGFDDPLGFLGHTRATVAGVDCRILRLSFTGELSYELHHPFADSVHLWEQLMLHGDDLGVRPHGLEALMRLRLEKGHVLVGQDSDYDSTPRRLRHEWAVNMDKGDFIGRHALTRTDRIRLDRILVGLEAEGPAPYEGAVIWHGDEYAGYVTSSAWSPTLGKSVMLAWLYAFDGVFPEEVDIEGVRAHRTSLPFYDPEGARARA
jgi:glycine cleavage system aminomethyltransferase T/bacterioferritin-associated ferredoxin